jgi:cobalamin biosynthesis Mg chelatase CobN
VGADGHTYYTVTESDGTFFEHVMESTDPGIIKKRTTTTTLTLTTTSVTATSVTTTTTATTATTTTTTKAADDVFTLMPSVEDMSDLNSKEIKELLKDIEKQVKDCEKIYGTASDDGEDKCASQRDLIDSVTTQYSAAKSKEDKEASGGSMTIIIAVVVVVVLVALIVAFIVVRKKGGNEKDLPTASFENPMSVALRTSRAWRRA